MIKPLRRFKRSIRRKIRGEGVARTPELQASTRRFWIGIGTLFAVIFSSFLFPLPQAFLPPSARQVGDIATEDITAAFDFPVYKSEDELEEETRQALLELPAILLYNQQVVDSVFAALDHLLVQVDSLKQTAIQPGRIADKLRLYYPQIRRNALLKLAQSQLPGEAKAMLNSVLKERYYVGIAPDEKLVPEGFTLVGVRKGGNEFTFGADQVLSIDSARQVIKRDFNILQFSDSTDAKFLSEIASPFVNANLAYSPLETERKREAVLSSIQPEKVIFKAGQRLVARNQQITKTHVEWLNAMAEYRSDRGLEAGVWEYLLPIIARVIFVAFVYLSFLLAFYHICGKEQFRVSRVFPLLLLMLLTLIAVYIASEKWNLSLYLFPYAAGIILVVTLYDLKTAILTTIANALLLGILFKFNFEVAFMAVIAGTTVSLSIREVKRRSDFYRCALYLALALAATAYILESLKFTGGDIILEHCGYAILNALISTAIAMVLLPLFESVFSFTTNVTLLELSDMNHPLLKRLALEAPGTYQHSLVVGNLAEGAAKAIGANPLLARVGAYYHDVGKAAISEYFVENQFGLKSKHDQLTPSMSALVIGSHIKRGREFAEEFDLPDKIIEFIEEHHGTSTMSFFYHKAKEQAESGDVNEDDYRYPGPKPQSKETAIMMLADSVEAASRTLEDPKPARIRNLIKRLINDRYQSGELSNCDLTLADLKKIEDSFVVALLGIFHSRIDYPKKEEAGA